jgi:poly(glycerol-phosphate) alpha-glucosyltransferase
MSERTVADGKLCGNITVIQLTASIAPESFGVGYAALNLAAALERAGVNVFLVSVDEEKDAYEACEEAGFPRERYVRGSLVGHPRLRYSPLLIRQMLKMLGNKKVLLHSHGLWTYMSRVGGALRERCGCPLVVSPHGSLEPYALTISPTRKAIASLLYERRNLMTASCLWALTEQEKTSIRAYGYTGHVAVIPNGVNRASACSMEEIAEFRRKNDVPPGSKMMLFLSRIARKKNLPLLLKTFARNVKTRPEWVLIIAGSDERGHLQEVLGLIRDLQIEKSVRLIGPVSGKEKASAFSSASVFVLPSHSEGLPIAVLEAMEYGKPIVATDGWTLPVTINVRYGWRVPADEGPFEAALLDVMTTSDATLMDMGRSAKSIVREHFDWDAVANQACSLYVSLLSNGHEGTNQRV